MSIFGSIMSKIFHHGSAAPAASAAPAPSSEGGFAEPVSTAGTPAATPAATPSAAPAAAPVDVGAVLTGLAANNPQKLNWQTSIVDLMKLLDLDSSLDARKTLANELHYSGDTNDSATMNIWLQKQVMQKLAENGGKVPDSLKA